MGALAFWLVTSYVVAFIINTVGSYWWTSFIFAFIIAIIMVIAHFVEKKKHIDTLRREAAEEMVKNTDKAEETQND